MIPQFLNVENNSLLPFAEMWMGTHKGAPSQVLANNTDAFDDLEKICGELPFLLKLIAIKKPLSIQAHPDKKQAEEGFKKEEKSGLSIDAPERNYKDSNHKPEILCAITPVKLMGGFANPEKIRESLEEFSSGSEAVKNIINPMINALKKDSLSLFFNTLFNLSAIEKECLCSCISEKKAGNDIITDDQRKLMKEFASLYPGDPAVLSPLYLNVLTIQPGQAVFIPAGILHAYVGGFGIELMTSSDNVLRGGLTPKHIDIGELMNILKFEPFAPQVISPPSCENWFCYQTPCAEFLLAYMRGQGVTVFPGNCPTVCVVTQGELETGSFLFKKGDSFFLAEGSEPCVFKGDFSLYAASGFKKSCDKPSAELALDKNLTE